MPRRISDEYRRSLRTGMPLRRVMASTDNRSGIRRDPLSNFWYSDPRGLRSGSAGQSVTPDSAQTIAAVYRAVRLISDDVAQLPLKLFVNLPERNEGGRTGLPGGKRRLRTPLAEVLGKQPNPRQTSYEFRQMLTAHVLLRGNGYARIFSGARGFVDRLEPLDPTRVRPELLDTGRVLYLHRKRDGTEERLTQEQVFHLRGYSTDPADPAGVSVVKYARTSLGLAMALEDFGAREFSQTPKPSFAITSPNVIEKERRVDLGNSFRAAFSGGGQGGVPVMDNGMLVAKLGMDHDDAQMLESRQFSVADVGRWFGVPPTKLGDLSSGTFSNTEQEESSYVKHGLSTWLTLWEQSMLRDLILDESFAEFVLDALLRGSSVERAQSNQIMLNGTALTANEWRARENLPPVPWGDSKPATQGAPAPAQPGRGPGTPAPRRQDEGDESEDSAEFAIANRLPTNGNGRTHHE